MGGKPGGTLWEKMNYAVGLEYGYSLPVARRLNLDFVIGLGYWGKRPGSATGSAPRKRKSPSCG